MTSNALRDWCRFSRTGAAFIEPGSPWENPFVESFNSRVRDELLSVESFSCLTEAKVMVEDYRIDYNRCRPHRAHGLMTPAAFAENYRAGLAMIDPGLSPLDGGEQALAGTTTTNNQLSREVDR